MLNIREQTEIGIMETTLCTARQDPHRPYRLQLILHCTYKLVWEQIWQTEFGLVPGMGSEGQLLHGADRLYGTPYSLQTPT